MLLGVHECVANWEAMCRAPDVAPSGCLPARADWEDWLLGPNWNYRILRLILSTKFHVIIEFEDMCPEGESAQLSIQFGPLTRFRKLPTTRVAFNKEMWNRRGDDLQQWIRKPPPRRVNRKIRSHRSFVFWIEGKPLSCCTRSGVG